MNDKFYALPEEKQSQILNAAYKVFATNQYKKAPTSEIAAEAGISKSLLFHYFHNKLELYLFLWKHAEDLTKNICVNIRYMKQMIFLKWCVVCKCQYKIVGFLSYKNVGKPTRLYDILCNLIFLNHILPLIL